MPDQIGDWVIEAAHQQRISFDLLPLAEAQALIQQASDRFAHGVTRWLWEKFSDAVALQDAAGWQKLTTFDGENAPVCLFFNSNEEQRVFVFQNCVDVVAILAETPHFEFYLTNRSTSYLIAFNHHDVLVAIGTAKAWLERVRTKTT